MSTPITTCPPWCADRPRHGAAQGPLTHESEAAVLPASDPADAVQEVYVSTVRIDDADGPGVVQVLLRAPALARMHLPEAVILGYALTRAAIMAGEHRPATDLLHDLPDADPTHGAPGPGGPLTT